ncbi:MAG: hypothetical protein ACR2KU_14815 [Gammaproteobacteria bacterium]
MLQFKVDIKVVRPALSRRRASFSCKHLTETVMLNPSAKLRACPERSEGINSVKHLFFCLGNGRFFGIPPQNDKSPDVLTNSAIVSKFFGRTAAFADH